MIDPCYNKKCFDWSFRAKIKYAKFRKFCYSTHYVTFVRCKRRSSYPWELSIEKHSSHQQMKFRKYVALLNSTCLRLVSIWSQTIADRRKFCDRLRSCGNTLLRSSAVLRSWSPAIAEDRTMLIVLSSAIVCDAAIIWKPKFCDLRSKNIPLYF